MGCRGEGGICIRWMIRSSVNESEEALFKTIRQDLIRKSEMEVVGARVEGSKTFFKSTPYFQSVDGVPILTFDHSVENFLFIMEAILELCGDIKKASFKACEIEQYKSMIVFVSEWKQFHFCEWPQFHYMSKAVNFTHQTESAEAKNSINGIKLPHFSSAVVPKVEKLPSTASPFHNDDFVLHVGGSVWALDWCPKLYENIGCDVKCEYLAISAHPTGSEYHKIGEQMSGRGFIQVWCFLHLSDKEELLNSGGCRTGKGSKIVNEDSYVPKHKRRPRKDAPSIRNEINGAGNIDVIDSSSGPFSVNVNAISRECWMSGECNRNAEYMSSCSAGNFDGNKEVLDYSDRSSAQTRKSRGRPRKISVAKTPRPRGRPKKYPISRSNECVVIHGDQLLDLSLLSTSDDIGTLSRLSPISVGCYIEELQRSIISVNDQNEQGKTLLCSGKPIHDACSQFCVNDSDLPLVSLNPPCSNRNVRSFSSGLGRHNKGSVPSEHNIFLLSENLLGSSISRSNFTKESVLIEKAIQVDSQGSFNNGECVIKSCLLNRKSAVEDEAVIIYDANVQSVKSKGSSPIREDHDLEGSVLPSHVDDFLKIVTVNETSVQDQSFIPKDIALPRLVLSIAHNGKVAWDMKWRPSDAADSKDQYHLGYLAVLLGDGSLEVWEVPEHRLVRLLYSGCHTESTDPRFMKLQPVFRCSRIKSGDRQSIPLSLEWSPSASRDLILAGCHDGTVALWKFCSQFSSQDTKPLLCFTADTVPIRSLAWAPDDSDVECSNLIVTAGHDGLKFWDLRCPYHPLLELCPVQRAVLGLDWLKDPRCVVIAYEDGNIRTLSLSKIANDMPVTGEPLIRTKQQGLHSQLCSYFAIWGVQVSRSTGLVAYCSSDGCTHYFQLTAEAVDKDSSRYRKPHFLCGSLTEEGPNISINTPLTCIPSLKQPLISKVLANEARPINTAMQGLCGYDGHATNDNNSQKKRKGNPSRQAKIGGGDAQDNEIRGDESRQNIARFPPKSVAMHKVRWNMNKGSGRWLCYGGAAGIVRCQVITPR